MALYENILIIALGGIANYFIIYKGIGPFYGLIGFAGLGLIMMGTGTGTTQSAVGIFILIGSLIKIIIDFIELRTKGITSIEDTQR